MYVYVCCLYVSQRARGCGVVPSVWRSRRDETRTCWRSARWLTAPSPYTDAAGRGVTWRDATWRDVTRVPGRWPYLWPCIFLFNAISLSVLRGDVLCCISQCIIGSFVPLLSTVLIVRGSRSGVPPTSGRNDVVKARFFYCYAMHIKDAIW